MRTRLRLSVIPSDPKKDCSAESKYLSCDEIAELADDCIKRMTASELISVIRSNHERLPSEISVDRLHVLDRCCLIRLAFLSRRCACNQCHDSEELRALSKQGCRCTRSGLDARP